MPRSALHVDLYQLTSLCTHHRAGRDQIPVTMAFFSRKLPGEGAPVRAFILQAALQSCLSWLSEVRFDREQIDTLRGHPLLGPRLDPSLLGRLANWRFQGIVEAPPDGTPLIAGRAVGADGEPLEIDGVRPAAYVPYLQVETDLLTAKLIETPLLSLINHMSMVASKAALVVEAARGRPVFEFGTRRTHPEAAVDAALAAYIGGCTATSNVEAYHRHRVPIVGTMDHFAVQCWEEPGLDPAETELRFFKAFVEDFSGKGVLLVDTYDTFGARTGIRNAVAAAGPGLTGIRIDSGVTPENVWKARRLLDELGAKNAQIVVSGGMDEASMRALGDAPVDGFGVGERIVTSPDAPVGVGAVAKLGRVGGRPTMKLSRGSGKATLPGRLQAWRTDAGIVVGLAGENVGGMPLLQRVWEGDVPCMADSPQAARERGLKAIAALSEADRQPRTPMIPITTGLEKLVRELVGRGTAA